MKTVSDLATRRAPIVAHDVATRTVTARLVTWDDARPVSDPDGSRYVETFARGSLQPQPRVYVVDEHGGNLVGHAVNHRDDGQGHLADLVIADTAAARDLMALVDAGTLDAVSIEFDHRHGEASWNAQRSAVTRRRAALHGVAFAFRPAHSAPVVSVREDNTMPLTTTRALELDRPTLKREIRRAQQDNPTVNVVANIDPYIDGENSYLRDLALSCKSTEPEVHNRILLHRALSDITTTTDPGLVTPGLPRVTMPTVNPVAAAPFLAAYAVRAEPYQTLRLPGVPTIVPTVQTTEKTAIASGGHISDAVLSANAVTVAWGADVSTPAYTRAPDEWLRVLFDEVAATLFAVADKTALAQVAATAGIATATTITAAIGAGVAAQPSERPPLLVLDTGHLDELTAPVLAMIQAGVLRVVLSNGLPTGQKAIVVGGRAVVAMRTDVEMLHAYDVVKLGADIGWFVQFVLTVRRPAAVVTVASAV